MPLEIFDTYTAGYCLMRGYMSRCLRPAAYRSLLADPAPPMGPPVDHALGNSLGSPQLIAPTLEVPRDVSPVSARESFRGEVL
jgi:hypothetical protein